MPHSQVFAVSIIGAISGGLITGSFMIWQAKREFKNRQDLINQEDRKTEKAVLQALRIEIETIWNRYKDNIKPELEKLLEPDYSNYFSENKKYQDDILYFHNGLLSFRFLISQDYFSIYNGNSSFIGRIKNSALRNGIVSAYTNIKGFLEIIIAFEKNQDKNEIILKNDLEEIFKNENYLIENRTNEMMLSYKHISNRIIEQLRFIKLEQDKLMEQINSLINLFENEINKNSIEIKENKLMNDKNPELTGIGKFLKVNGDGFTFNSAMRIIENSVILGLVMYIGVINLRIYHGSNLENHHKFLYSNIGNLISGVVLILLSIVLVAFNSLKLSLYFVKNKQYKKPLWQRDNWSLIGLSFVLFFIFFFFIFPIFSYKLQSYDYSFQKNNLNLKNSVKTKRSLQSLNRKGKMKAH